VPMEWSSEEAILAVLDNVSKREGFGELFANGIVEAAQTIANGDGMQYANQDRNISVPLEFPERGVTVGGGGGTQMMTAATQFLWWHPPLDRHALFQFGGELYGISQDEAEKMFDGIVSEWAEKNAGSKDAWKPDVVEGKAKYVWANENAVSISDITGHCDGQSARLPHAGMTWSVEEAAKTLTAMSGRECTVEWLMDGIQRKRLLQVSYNVLCDRMIGEIPEISAQVASSAIEPIKDGFFKGLQWDLEKCETVGEEYCELRGCDPDTGLPTKEELERLGLAEVADLLEENE
jgi:aldehyde:ferredoxin oxidoreductase